MKQTNSIAILIITMSVAILTPFGNDIYIPSLPEIANVLHTDKSQLILSVFLAGLAISQLFYGPLLDRFGRKPVLSGGLTIFTISSIVIMFTNDINTLLVARFFQAVGTCSTITSSLAIVRDSFPREKTASIVSIIMGLIAICPTVAPILGSYFQVHFGWHGSFGFLLTLGAIYLAVVVLLFNESMQEKNYNATNLGKIMGNYKLILMHRQYLGFILTSCFSYSVLFSYIASAPFFMITLMHISPGMFGYLFSLSALGIITMNFLAPTLSKRVGFPPVLIAGALLIIIGGSLLFAFTETAHVNIKTLIASMLIVSAGVGLIRPTASAGAMNIFPPTVAGSAAAMFGFFSFSGGSIASTIAARYGHNQLLPFSILVIILGCCALCSAIISRGNKA